MVRLYIHDFTHSVNRPLDLCNQGRRLNVAFIFSDHAAKDTLRLKSDCKYILKKKLFSRLLFCFKNNNKILLFLFRKERYCNY